MRYILLCFHDFWTVTCIAVHVWMRSRTVWEWYSTVGAIRSVNMVLQVDMVVVENNAMVKQPLPSVIIICPWTD